jgi:poly(3-hydroxybutyrate) depolymerase
MQMNLDRHIDAHAKLFNHLIRGDGESADATKRFYDEYLAVLDLPAEFYLETVERVFQRHLLPRGLLEVHGSRVEPKAIAKTALLTVEGELDDISAPGQTLAAHDICSGLAPEMKQNALQKGVGHYGIFNGRRWREDIMPTVREWIRRHDQGRAPVPAVDLAPAAKPAKKARAA